MLAEALGDGSSLLPLAPASRQPLGASPRFMAAPMPIILNKQGSISSLWEGTVY